MNAAQEGQERPSKPDWRQTITTLAGIVSVLLVALGLWYTNGANRAQENLTEQGQVTDRFGSAVDQLGSDQLDVRLGGIYALERLTHDSPGDEASILEVLSADRRDRRRHLGRVGGERCSDAQQRLREAQAFSDPFNP